MTRPKPGGGWDSHPNLRRGANSSRNKGRGRLQRQIARVFLVHGSTVSAAVIYDWCRRWQRRHDRKRINQRERHSIVRILVVIADRVGRADTLGKPWLWRLRDTKP